MNLPHHGPNFPYALFSITPYALPAGPQSNFYQETNR